ncbi:MAG: hypothetical protein AAFP77_13630 [Bacteroidota bacterium]
MQYNSGVVAQTAPELVLPVTLDGVIQLDVSSIPNQNRETPDYDLFAVFVENESEAYTSNAIQGRYTKEGDILSFKPYFPFEPGLTYIAKVRSANYEGHYFLKSFQIEEQKAAAKAGVLSIYPSASQLPENLLRFYLYFNTPMQQGQALSHIQLVDAVGNMDQHAFMEFKQELWSADGKRLTLLFDPGRIKRGVSTNLRRGPALLEGRRFELRISSAWKDVYGQELGNQASKEIEVVSPYRQQINVNEWVANPPNLNSQDTLRIHFDRILDYALLQSMIQLQDAEKNLIEGHWEVLQQEQLIQFIPTAPWRQGNYQIVVNSRLEDVAGNSLQNLLDHMETSGENDDRLYHIIEFKL